MAARRNNRNVHTPLLEYRTMSDSGSGLLPRPSPFAPNVAATTTSNKSPAKPTPPPPPPSSAPVAPEKDLTLFAVRLALMEKAASTVGTLAFIWATVVLLGGFAITLKEIDFWFVTVILVIEGARIFGRSHELEWQHQDGSGGSGSLFSMVYRKSSNAFKSGSAAFLSIGRAHDGGTKEPRQRSPAQAAAAMVQVITSSAVALQSGGIAPSASAGLGGDMQRRRLKRQWSISRVPLMSPLLRARLVSRLLYWLQLCSACAAIGMSVYRLCTRSFTAPEEDTAKNHTSALLIFYSLAAFEALVFLLERIYWEIQISGKQILSQVNRRCGLSEADLATTRRFFYDVYSKCLTESIFEGLKMDMVDYGLSWLQSDRPDEQLGGIRVLLIFSQQNSDARLSEDTLQSLAAKQGAVERLLEMVTWKNPEQRHSRSAAADLLSRLVKYNRYSIRVAAIAGSIEAIFSLTNASDEDRFDDTGGADYIGRGVGEESVAPVVVETQYVVGLRILKNLAKDPLNCAKIGQTRGVLTRLSGFIQASDRMLRNAEEPRHKIALLKKSLELLNLLVGAPGAAGKMLREEITKIVFTISNLRSILDYGESHMVLQQLAAEILCSLAMDEGLKETIGRTGGVMRVLLALLMKERVEGEKPQVELSQKAGQVLALLALKSKENCRRMMKWSIGECGDVHLTPSVADGADGGSARDVVTALMDLIADWEVGDLAMNILRSFCAYADDDACRRRIATVSTAQVVKMAVDRGGRAQMAALGLLSKTVGDLKSSELLHELQKAGIVEHHPPATSEKGEDSAAAAAMAERLVRILERHQKAPEIERPYLRRYTVELAVAMANHHPGLFRGHFHRLKVRSLLHRVADTVTELENYATFMGAVGVTLHSATMSSLLDQATHESILDGCD